MEHKDSWLGESFDIKVLGSLPRRDLTSFSYSMRNSWEDPCFSHVMWNTIGWKFDESELDSFWKNYWHSHLRSFL